MPVTPKQAKGWKRDALENLHDLRSMTKTHRSHKIAVQNAGRVVQLIQHLFEKEGEPEEEDNLEEEVSSSYGVTVDGTPFDKVKK